MAAKKKRKSRRVNTVVVRLRGINGLVPIQSEVLIEHADLVAFKENGGLEIIRKLSRGSEEVVAFFSAGSWLCAFDPRLAPALRSAP